MTGCRDCDVWMLACELVGLRRRCLGFAGIRKTATGEKKEGDSASRPGPAQAQGEGDSTKDGEEEGEKGEDEVLNR
eukprot:3786198-Rhodomonas_salina.2